MRLMATTYAAPYAAPTLTPADAVGAQRLRQLQDEGFCIVPDMAPPALIEHTQACVERAVATQDAERLARTRSPGTLIDSDGYPELADLIGNPAALGELHRMGFTDIKFWKAVIISKPPGGPRLYWHQDCMLWQDPRSYSEVPGMIFLMYYLEDTSRHNGCLRLLPGSHRRRLDLHDLGVAHEVDINSMENSADPRFLDHDGEVDVPVRAGATWWSVTRACSTPRTATSRTSAAPSLPSGSTRCSAGSWSRCRATITARCTASTPSGRRTPWPRSRP